MTTIEELLPHLSDVLLDPLMAYLLFGWTWEYNPSCSSEPYLVSPGAGGQRDCFYPYSSSHARNGIWNGGLPRFSTTDWGAGLVIAELRQRGLHMEKQPRARETCIRAALMILKIERYMPRPRVEMRQGYDGPRQMLLPPFGWRHG